MAGLERSELLTQLHRLYRDGTSAFESDGQLLDRYLTARDESAFETIVERHGPLVLSLCRRFLHDRCDVEDAFQATFLILARKASSIRNRPALSSWLYGVAFKVATRARVETLRRREREATGLDFEPPAGTSPEPDDLGPAIDEELSRLPEKFRAPIVLCYLRERTHDQAAAELRWPVGTVRSRLARGRSLLRDRLIRRGCTPVASLIGMAPGGSLGRFAVPVPAPLVAATVAEAGRFLAGSASSTIRPFLFTFLTSSSTSTGSATTLAQGVLTTMTFTPIKLVAAGLTAGVLAGGLGTGAYVLRPMAAGQQKAETPAAVPSPEQEKRPPVRLEATLPAGAEVPIDARLNALERKLDLLLERLTPPYTITSADPVTAAPGLDELPTPGPEAAPPIQDLGTVRRRPAGEPTRRRVLPSPSAELPASRTPAPSIKPPNEGRSPFEQDAPAVRAPADRDIGTRTSPSISVREIEAAIRNGIVEIGRCKQLYQRGSISAKEYQAPVEQVQVLLGRLRGIQEELGDEADRQQIEIQRAEAELKVAQAEQKAAEAGVSGNQREIKRNPGVVSTEDAARAESELAAAAARVDVRQASLAAAQLRLKQIRTRSEAAQKVLDSAEKQLKEVEAVRT